MAIVQTLRIAHLGETRVSFLSTLSCSYAARLGAAPVGPIFREGHEFARQIHRARARLCETLHYAVVTLIFSAFTGDGVAVRLTSNGALDNTFDGDGVRVVTQMDEVYALGVDKLGRIVLGGTQNGAVDSSNDKFDVGRLTSTGQVDTSFNGTG